MSGMGGGDLYVSSWGYDNLGEELDPAPWRRWSISWKGERKLFIVVPPEIGIDDVMTMASAMVEGGSNASFCVRHDWDNGA